MNKTKKVFLIDSDNTLRNSKGIITDKVKEAISYAKSEGHEVILATSRPRYHTLEIKNLAGVSDVIVSSTGAEMYDSRNQEVISSHFIKHEELFKFIDLAYKHDVRLILCVDDIDYVTKNPTNNIQIVLNKNTYKDDLKDKNVKAIVAVDFNELIINQLKQYVMDNSCLNVTNEKERENENHDYWFSLGDINTSKGNALVELATYFNVDISNTIAIGDGMNDISMFKTAGYSIAMDNANDNIKKYANFITKSNDEDGVAYAIYHVLGE